MELTNMKNEVYSDSEEIWLEEIMTEYGDKMIRVAYSYIKDWGISQEIVQEVFITCYKNYSQYSKVENFKAMIYKITINRSKDVLRSYFVKKVFVGIDIFSTPESPDLSPESHVLKNDESTLIASSILSLPLKYREIIHLFYYENFSITEISEMLKVNQNTIKSRLKRSRKMLGHILEGSETYER